MKTFPTLTALALGATTLSWAPALAGSPQELAAENFVQADADADGALTLDEFKALIDLNAQDGIGRASLIRRMGREEMAFGRIDADADGLLSTDEISAMAARSQE